VGRVTFSAVAITLAAALLAACSGTTNARGAECTKLSARNYKSESDDQQRQTRNPHLGAKPTPSDQPPSNRQVTVQVTFRALALG